MSYQRTKIFRRIFIGNENATTEFIQNKIADWKTQLETLAEIAKVEPQAAYAGFLSGLKHKFTYHMRVLPNISEYLKPLDDLIDTKFIPAITEGHICSPVERYLLSLGRGHGHSNFSRTSIK